MQAYTGKTQKLQPSRSKTYKAVDTEWRVLAALLDTRNKDWANRISEGMFTDERIDVFKAMKRSAQEYGTINFEGVSRFLGGNIPGEVLAASGANINAAVDEAVRIAKKRQAFELGLALQDLSEDHYPDETTVKSLMSFEPIMAEEDSTIQSGAQLFMQNLREKKSGDYKFAKTGLTFLDSNMGNEWKPKSLVILMGGAGSGKTALVGNSMTRMAINEDNNDVTGEATVRPIGSLFISLEMAKEDLIVRMVADRLSIDSKLIQSGKLTEQQMVQVETEMVRLQLLDMHIIDKSDLSLSQIVYEIRRHVNNKYVRVVFIDYLQIVQHRPTGNTNNDLGEVAKVLKNLAKDLDITIVLLSQINRGDEGLNALRDTGVAGAVADVVVQIIPDEDDNSPVRAVNVAYWKNRFGAVQKTSVLFNGPYQRFEGASY